MCCGLLSMGEKFMSVTYASETEIAKCTDPCSGIKEKVRWLDISVDDVPRVDVTEGTQKAAEV
jgi:hypothetical protein